MQSWWCFKFATLCKCASAGQLTLLKCIHELKLLLGEREGERGEGEIGGEGVGGVVHATSRWSRR